MTPREGQDRSVPPIIVNVPPIQVLPAQGLPGWVAPVLGLVGVLVGLFGNNLLARIAERRVFRTEKSLQLYLDLQDEEYVLRDWADTFDGNQPVLPDWTSINRRWSSHLLRLPMFASPEVQTLAREYYDQMHKWLLDAERATRGASPDPDEKGRLQAAATEALETFSRLYLQLRADMGVPLV